MYSRLLLSSPVLAAEATRLEAAEDGLLIVRFLSLVPVGVGVSSFGFTGVFGGIT